MKRAEKIALLSKILSGQISEETRQQLHQSNGPGAVVIIYQLGDNVNPGPDDVVSFSHKSQLVTMPYKEIKAFTQYEPLTICFIPDNNRRSKPH